MSIDKLKEVIKTLKENSLKRIKYSHEGLDIEVESNGISNVDPVDIDIDISEAPTEEISIISPVEVEKEEEEGDYICSPLQGTFYSSSGPGESPFVDVGSDINIGDTLCIVEAMKMFNEVAAEMGGTIKEVLKKDGEPVKTGDQLFRVVRR